MDLDQVVNKLCELKQDEAMREYYNQAEQPVYQPKSNPLPPLVKKIQDNFSFFGLTGIIYALFFTFCLYKNASGITAPFFALGTICYFYLCIRKLDIPIKKGSLFYAVGIAALGINLCMTADGFIIACDYIGIVLLLFSGLLHLFYEDRGWGLFEYLSAIFNTAFGTFEFIACPFVDMRIWRLSRKGKEQKNNNLKYVFLGILIGSPLLLVVMALLISADLVFDRLFVHLLDPVIHLLYFDGAGDFVGILFMILSVYILSYCLLIRLGSRRELSFNGKRQTYEPLIAITINAMLAVVYLIFSFIQIVYLFAGRLSLPDGYTYAEYARQGFFQLLLVCIINITLVLICLYKFRESKVLKGMLTLISVCTYIMIASSLLRMRMYVEAYGMTYLRVLVFWGLGLIFFIMSGIVIYIFHQHFPLFDYCMVVVTVLYLGLAYIHPDYLIAAYNLDEQRIDGQVDYHYLNRLSTDAFPAIREAVERGDNPALTSYFELFTSHVEYYMENYMERNENALKDGIRSYNFSRAQLKEYIISNQ